MSFAENLDDLVTRNENGLTGIHESWTRVSLSDVCTILNGFAFSSSHFNLERGIPLIRIRDVIRSESATHYDGEYDESYLVRSGDLLIGMDGDFNAAIWAGPPGLLNQRVCKLIPDERFYELRFLAYGIQGYLSAINAKTSSITVKHLSSKTISNIPLPLPSLPEQHRIVEAIESYLSRLDDAVVTLERVQRNLKRYRASVLKAAVEGRLVSTEAELARQENRDYEPASVLLERILKERKRRFIQDAAEKACVKAETKSQAAGKLWTEADNKKTLETERAKAATKYKEPAAPDTDELPELPEGWCWASVDQLLAETLINGKSVPTAEIGFPVLRLTALVGDSIALSERKIGRWDAAAARNYLVKQGDVLVSRGNGSIRLVGRGGLVELEPDPVAFPDTMIRIRLLPGFFVSRLFVALWNSRIIRDSLEPKAKTTAGIYKVNQQDLMSTPVPIAPIAEQKRLLAEIERCRSISEFIESTIPVELNRCIRLRQSILKWAFEGKLVDQDPNDEPASVLLERIKAERTAQKASKKTTGRRGRKRKST